MMLLSPTGRGSHPMKQLLMMLLLLTCPLACHSYIGLHNVAPPLKSAVSPHSWYSSQRQWGNWHERDYTQSNKKMNPLLPSLARINMKLFASTNEEHIDYQSDESSFGRGENHLSAFLNEGDVVVYQTGTWTVDGVEVGDGTPPKLRYAKVDTIQLVWTHNCEHGVIRGIELELDHREEEGRDGSEGNEKGSNQRLVVSPTYEFVEFGPEQLVARVPVQWDDINEDEGTLLATLPRDLLVT